MYREEFKMKPMVVVNLIILLVSLINLIVLHNLKEQTQLIKKMKKDFTIIVIGEFIFLPLYIILV